MELEEADEIVSVPVPTNWLRRQGWGNRADCGVVDGRRLIKWKWKPKGKPS